MSSDGEDSQFSSEPSVTEEEEEEVEEEEQDDEIIEELEKDENGTPKRKLDHETDGSVKKRKKGVNSDLYKPPTVKELNELRETTNLFHSNLFRLQVEEMLNEIKVKTKYSELFGQWFVKLKSFLQECKSSEVFQLSDKTLEKKLKIKIPFRPCQNYQKGTFHFVSPTEVFVAGSYKMQCCVGPKAKLDVRIQIPKICFQKGDHLNQKYNYKHALYLAFLAEKLQDSDLVEEIHFSHAQGNCQKTVLELQPSGKLSKYISVVLHLSVPPNVFKPLQFAPYKNTIKPSWFFGEPLPEEDLGTPTPHYNNSVLQDMVGTANEDALNEVLQKRPNLRDGILLLKVWLHQRGMDEGHGCFGGFIISMYVVYLLKSKLLNNSMSSYQVVRIVWSNLAQSDWTKNGITLAPDSSQLSLEQFHQHFEVVFVDVSGYCNICANVSEDIFFKVKHECELAIRFLDNPNINSFQVLFMTPMEFLRQCDHVICLRDPMSLKKIADRHGNHAMKLDYAGCIYPQALTLILRILREGLGQRVTLISVKPPSPCHWAVNQPAPLLPKDKILIGYSVVPEFAFNILEKGPPANFPEAKKFRQFWGEKSELRRFQDGSISEAVVWNGHETLAEKRVICKSIVQYLLESRLSLESISYLYIANQVETLLYQKALPSGIKYGTGEEATLAVLKSFDNLAKQMRSLQDIPLDISTVQGISAVFRYCEVFPPIPIKIVDNLEFRQQKGNCCILTYQSLQKKVPDWLLPVEAIVQLGLSGKWPNNLDAVRRIRAAFNVKIAKCLSEQCKLRTQPYPNHVDVYKDGFIFRLQVAYQREIGLLKEKITPEGEKRFQDTHESLSLEEKIVNLPKLTGSLHGLHQQFPSFGPTCCLAKRWMSAHLLSPPHVPEICIELLVAHLYLSPEPLEPPNQPQLGFLRFLHLISFTDWSTTPIILNFNAEMSRDDVLKIENRFHSARSGLPPMFIATPYDQKNSWNTKESPTLQILIRVAMLAEKALEFVQTELMTYKQPNCMKIFQPSLNVYDAVIHLLHFNNPRSHESVSSDGLSGQVQKYEETKGRIPVVGFDPVQYYLQELRESYSNFALFFHDCYGGNVIGVLWKPSTSVERDFKVSHANCQKLTSRSETVFNVDAALEDFYILGSGLVKNIDTKEVLLPAD